jgi:hypothetical protein
VGVRKSLCQEAVLRGLVGGGATLLSVDHEPCDAHGLFVFVLVHVVLRAGGRAWCVSVCTTSMVFQYVERGDT